MSSIEIISFQSENFLYSFIVLCVPYLAILLFHEPTPTIPNCKLSDIPARDFIFVVDCISSFNNMILELKGYFEE